MGVKAYCYFCQTQRCKLIASLIRSAYGLTCITPKIIQRKWIKGQAFDETHDWLPGYVFVYSEDEIDTWFKISGIIRMLGNGPLHDSDEQFAMSLLASGGTIGHVKVLNVGDRCVIKDPVWEDVCGQIIKMDRNRKRCCIEFQFDENKRQVWVGYDMLDAIEQTGETGETNGTGNHAGIQE